MPPYPFLRVHAEGQLDIDFGQANGISGTGLVADDGSVFNQFEATAFLTITNAAGAVVLTNAPMTFIAPNNWRYTATADLLLTGAGPWLAAARVYDATGLTGVKLATVWLTLEEDDTVA